MSEGPRVFAVENKDRLESWDEELGAGKCFRSALIGQSLIVEFLKKLAATRHSIWREQRTRSLARYHFAATEL